MTEEMSQFATTLAGDNNLSQAAMQQMIDFHTEQMRAAQETVRLQAAEAVATQSNTWVEAAKNKWGDKVQDVAKNAADVLRRFGGEGLIEDLDATGFGNHPGLIEVFANIHKVVGEGKATQATSSTPARDKSSQNLGGLYPSMIEGK